MIFVGFCELILLEGAVEALVTLKNLDHLHTTVANLTNCLVALVFGLTMSALAPVIAVALHDVEIKETHLGAGPLASVVNVIGCPDLSAEEIAEI